MKRPIAKSLLVGIMSFGVAAVVAHAGQVRQFSAQFLNFDGTEQSTTLEPSSGGQPIYRGSVFVSADVDTLEITISATGDLLDGGVPVTNSLWLNCQVDGNACNGGYKSRHNQLPRMVPIHNPPAGPAAPEH